jgi:hypothetical protein
MSHKKTVIGGVPVLVSRPAVSEPAPFVLLSHGFTRSKEDWAGEIGAEDRHYDGARVERFYDELRELYDEESERLIVHPGVAHELTAEMWANAVAWLEKYL